MTTEEQLVLNAIKAEAGTIRIIARDTKLDKHTVGDVIATLANQGIIRYEKYRGWISVYKF